MKYLIILLVFLCFSCSNTKIDYINLEEIAKNILPSLEDDMFFNLRIDKNQLPDSITEIIQVYNNDTINILKFDSKNNLIFKFYRQYVGEYWNDKYVTMIEAHIYNHEKLTKSYFLHSNTDFEILTYSYYRNNISQMKLYRYQPIESINNNPNYKIKYLHSFKKLLEYISKLDIENSKNLEYTIKRDFRKDSIVELIKTKNEDDFSIRTKYYVDSLNRIYRITDAFTERAFTFDNNNRIFKERNYDRTLGITNIDYYYNNDTTRKIESSNGKKISSKILLNQNIIYLEWYRNFDTSNYERYNYVVDGFGVPYKSIIRDSYADIDSIVILKTYYK